LPFHLSQNASQHLDAKGSRRKKRTREKTGDFMTLSCLRFCQNSAEIVEFVFFQFYTICTFSPFAIFCSDMVRKSSDKRFWRDAVSIPPLIIVDYIGFAHDGTTEICRSLTACELQQSNFGGQLHIETPNVTSGMENSLLRIEETIEAYNILTCS